MIDDILQNKTMVKMTQVWKIDTIQIIIHVLFQSINLSNQYQSPNPITNIMNIIDWFLAIVIVALLCSTYKQKKMRLIQVAHLLISVKTLIPMLNVDSKEELFYDSLNPDLKGYANWSLQILFWYFNCFLNFIMIILLFN